MTSWMKKLISCSACLLIPLGLIASDADQESILSRIDELQRQVTEQQATIAELQTQLGDASAVDEALDTRGLAVEGGAPLSLGSNIDGLTIKGDLRLRYEYREEEDDEDDSLEKSRFRTRFRLGFVWKNSTESWEIGAGLASGQESSSWANKGGSSGKSTNDSWNGGGVWETGDIYLDYAYAKHNWEAFSLTLGQQKNPWETTFIMFDGDLRPTGATAQYESDLFFVTIGAYNLRTGDGATPNNDEPTNAFLYAGQLGLTLEMEPVKALLAVAYFHYDSEIVEIQNSTALQDSDYRWEIGSLYAELAATIADIKLKLYGELAINFGADSDGTQGRAKCQASDWDSEDENMAWILGAQASAFGFKIKYAYAVIEGDSMPWFVTDSDFGAAIPGGDTSVNVEGHKFGLSYGLTSNCSINGTVILTELVEPGDSCDDLEGTLYQIDLKYRF